MGDRGARTGGALTRSADEDLRYLLMHASRLLSRQLELRLRQLGMSYSTFMVLRSIASMKGRPAMIVEVADDLHLDPSAVAEAVEEAAEHGWLAVEPIPGARRARVLVPTAKAKSAVPALADASHWTTESALNGLTHEEIAQLTSHLRQVVRNLEAAEHTYARTS